MEETCGPISLYTVKVYVMLLFESFRIFGLAGITGISQELCHSKGNDRRYRHGREFGFPFPFAH